MALERTTVRRAVKERRCGDYVCRNVIRPGDLYNEHVTGPGHPELGNTRWLRLPECAECGARYGRAPVKPAADSPEGSTGR
jgi:hypothetical protein